MYQKCDRGVKWCNKDAAKVLQECDAVTWFNKDVIKVLQGCIIV